MGKIKGNGSSIEEIEDSKGPLIEEFNLMCGINEAAPSRSAELGDELMSAPCVRLNLSASVCEAELSSESCFMGERDSEDDHCAHSSGGAAAWSAVAESANSELFGRYES